MERGIIAISENGMVTMPTAPVWMTMEEIADICLWYSATTSAQQYMPFIRIMSYWKKKRNGTSDKSTEHVTRCIALKW